jgi:uncharacterized protein (DUF58 family)
MDTDRFYDALPREQTVLKSRPWYVLAAALLLVSLLTRQPVAFFAAGFALVLGLLPELWYRFALRGLFVSHQLSQHSVPFGERLTLTLMIENQKGLPLPWLEIEEEVPADAILLNGRVSPTYKPERNALVNACSLWSFQRVTRRSHLRCFQGGRHVFGPTIVRSTDPFGWLMHEERLEGRQTLIVTPLLASLPAFGLPARYPFGMQATPQRLLEDPLRIAGLRAYQWGDEPRRINWKATARTGSLQSKVYEPGDQHRLLLLLDSRTFLESWLGIDPDLQELTICAAASLAHHWLNAGYPVGLATNGTLPSISSAPEKQRRATPLHIRVPIASGARQQTAILNALGQLMTYLSIPMEGVIAAERASLPYGTTVVLVGTRATLQDGTIRQLLALRRRGIGVHLALTGDKGEALPVKTADLPIHQLGGREVWHALLQSASDQEA